MDEAIGGSGRGRHERLGIGGEKEFHAAAAADREAAKAAPHPEEIPDVAIRIYPEEPAAVAPKPEPMIQAADAPASPGPHLESCPICECAPPLTI